MTRAIRGALLAVAVLAPAARADTVNFDMSGKLYTKYMYQNDNTQGCLSLSNPFWVDNIGGHNGACTEFELNIKATVGPRVSAGVRLQSRWGALWQDWWENGDLKPGVQDTSGESLGMNHAQYIKLRGAFVRLAPPIPTVKWVTVGSTDYSMWNEWTIGKARYIDRDNGDGVFFEGSVLPNKQLDYTFGAMALPKLWAGPGWNTGLSYNDTLASLWGTDWAFAAKLDTKPMSDLKVKVIGNMLRDWEADRNSPQLTGAPDAARGADHSVALTTRFRGYNATVDGVYTPSNWDFMQVSGLLAGSSNWVNPAYATNLVRNGQGFSPVLFKTDAAGNPIASNALAATLRAEFFDPWKIGLSMKFEYFNIGSEYNAVMGARREADVLLTDGIITGGFTRGGQLPTLNIANEFQDWDEPWYESCIGWNGVTAIFEEVRGPLKATLEGTYIGYNTNNDGGKGTVNGQPGLVPRDTQNQYPDFLYTHGFTDTTAFTADSDYANIYDRGKDPRSVYDKYQDRWTGIGVLGVQYLLPSLPGAVLNLKGKYVFDRDNRAYNNPNDDYVGRMGLAFASMTLQPTNELKTSLGYEYTRWTEQNREGNENSGFTNSRTVRHTARAGMSYAFGGALMTYTLEYFHKDLYRDQATLFDMKWNVWRAKATFEAGW